MTAAVIPRSDADCSVGRGARGFSEIAWTHPTAGSMTHAAQAHAVVGKAASDKLLAQAVNRPPAAPCAHAYRSRPAGTAGAPLMTALLLLLVPSALQ